MKSRTGLRGGVSRGFTLIEIMVVVAILAILAATVVPQFMDKPDEARVTAAKGDIKAIEAALNLYRLDNFNYPTTDQGLEALVAQPTSEPVPPNWKPYLKNVPKDPWQNEYQYLSPGENGEIDIYSLGRDGQPGGEKFAADIGNWVNN